MIVVVLPSSTLSFSLVPPIVPMVPSLLSSSSSSSYYSSSCLFSSLPSSPSSSSSWSYSWSPPSSTSTPFSTTTITQPNIDGLYWPTTHPPPPPPEEDELDEEWWENVLDNIIKIYTTHTEHDHLMPWQRLHQVSFLWKGGTVYIEGGVKIGIG